MGRRTVSTAAVGLLLCTSAAASGQNQPRTVALAALLEAARAVPMVPVDTCLAGPVRALAVDELTLRRGPVDFIWGGLESPAIRDHRALVAQREWEASLATEVGADAIEARLLDALPAPLPGHLLVLRIDTRLGAVVDGAPAGSASGHAFVVGSAAKVVCSVPFDLSVTTGWGNTTSWRPAKPSEFEGRMFNMILPTSLEVTLTDAVKAHIRAGLARRGMVLELP